MLDIRIEYNQRTERLSHPENYNELIANQYRAVVQYFIIPEKPLSERIPDRILLMQELLDKRINKLVKGRWYRVINSMVDDGILDDLLKLQEFLFHEQTFNNWLIKEVAVGKQKYFGPRDRFSYMTFGEFISADMLFMQYFNSKDENTLNRFIAALYKENEKEEFSTDKLNEKAKVFEKLSAIDKHGIVFNYSALRHWLTEKYKFVFGRGDKKESNEINLGSNQNGWMSIRRNLAGDVLNLEKIDKVLLHDVLSDLNEKMSK